MLDRVLGLDLGTTTLGIAYSDPFGFVHGIETFRFDKNQYIVARKHVLKLVEEMMIKEIAIGLPLHLSGEMSEMANNVIRFKDDLLKENPHLIINLVDERLSSVSANRSISEQGLNHKKRKESVDRIAACIILDTYIRMKGN
ncbi:MAG: Holliday junction resolvase RuvX [Bacilli bacterium]|nr:Holliday junction resolvase RuvX [Bacilli bacterium]